MSDEGNEASAPTPELRTHNRLKEDDIRNLEVITDEDFSDIIDSMLLNDYRRIPNVIRLPNIRSDLAEKLGLEKDSAFIMKNGISHIRPDRKGSYGQAFSDEEYRMIPEVMRNANFAVVDKYFKNFQIVFDDQNEENKVNKIVFNKDKLGNYLITIGKVDRQNAFSEERNEVVGVGFAPTIRTLRMGVSSTRLRASPTTENSIAQEDKSVNEKEVTMDTVSKAPFQKMVDALAAIDAYCTGGIVPKGGRFILPGTPEYLKRIGSDETEITLPVSVVKKAMETHHLTKDEIKSAVCGLYDPVLAFDSDKSKTENKADSRLILTNEFKDGKPIALSVNVNADVQFQKDGHRTILEVQDIRSIHDRTLTAKNGTDMIKKWTEDGLCRYVDDKKITDWSTIARVYFPIEVLQSADSNILRKSDIVNGNFSEERNEVVGVGVAPTIYHLRLNEGDPATRLRPSPTTENSVAQEDKSVNEREESNGREFSAFDDELGKFFNGKIAGNHIFNLGKPGEILQKCGFPKDHRIELSGSRLMKKAKQRNHPFDITDVKGLDRAIQNPVAVFEYGNKEKSQNVIVELQRDEKNFLVGVFFNQKQRGYEVSDIRGLFNRDNIDWIRWIEQGKMIYGDKERIQVLAAQQRSNFAEVNRKEARTSSDSYYLDSADSIMQKFGDVKDVYTENFEFYKENKERYKIFKAFRDAYQELESIETADTPMLAKEFYEALKNDDTKTLLEYTGGEMYPEIAERAGELVRSFNLEHSCTQKLTDKTLFSEERNEYRTEKHIDKENKEMETKPNEETNNIITPKEYLKNLLSKAEIEVIEDTGVMRAILDEGKRVQKMAAKYGTNHDIDGGEAFNGFGTYVVSVNEENARQLGIKIASKKYGGNFYINGQPFNEFLKEKNFSPYWASRLEQFKDYNVEYLADDFLRADVKGNPALEKERDTLSTLFSLDLVEYKRERAFLYSVDIPDNDSTNYLLYGSPIGIESANRINERLERMNVEWRVTRNDIGKNVYFNTLSEKVFGGSQESASRFLKEIGYVGMEMNTANYIVFDDKDMKVTDRVQYMIDGESNVYGFAYDGRIYADPEIATSNTYAHEYTHLWDAYTRRTNPELWEKGKDIFKGTSLWNEVMTDENYQNLSDDDEILSECHSRIVGRMAEKVLSRIAEKNGGILRDQVIDWDNEVAEYVAGELGAEFLQPELGGENYVSDSVRLEIAREFLSRPMKDLMEGRKIGIEREQSELYKENEAELKFIVEEMMEETLPGLQKMAQPVENEKDPAASTSTQLSGATSAQGLLDAQDTATAISTHIHHKNNIVEIKNQGHFIDMFNAFAGEIANADTPMSPNDFLDRIKKTFDMNVAAGTTGYAFKKENDETFKIRISDHKAVLRNRLGARTELTSLVIQLNDSRRRDSDKAKLSEFVYFPESLDKETQVGIINGINDWISGHEYTDKHYDQMYVSTARALQERLKESEQTVEKMAEDHAFLDVREYFKFNRTDSENFEKALDNFDGRNPLQLIKVGEIPPVMKALGISDNPIEMPQSVVSKALREEATYPNDKKGHALTMEHVKRIPESLADPIMVFKSRTRDDSYVFFTEQKDESDRSIIIPVAVDKRYGRLVINEITSIYGRTNEVDFVKTNIEQGNLVYADKKRSLGWERECQVQFLAQVLPSEGSYSSILTKENLVNFVSAVGKEKIQKMAESVENKENRTMENEMANELVEEQEMDSYYKRFVKEASDKTDEGQLQKAFALSLEKNIVQLTEVKLNRENWNRLFPNGFVETPVGTVKLGENQFEKLQKSDRSNLLGAMYETLSNPAIILEKETFDKNSGDFKPVNVYGKSFVHEDSNHKRAVEAVVIFKDGEEISISTHNKDINGFVKQIKTADQIIYADSEISRVASLILQNGGSHVRLQDAISNRAINLKYNKNNVLSINDIEFSQEEVAGKENAAKNMNGDAEKFSLDEGRKPAEENVAATKKTVKASEIFKDFEESMIFAGISHKEFDRAMLGYLHQRSGREEAGNGTFDTQAMFELLVVQKIHDARTRAFVFGKIGQYEGMTVEFDADNIDLGYLKLSDREGAEEVRKELEELKAAHPTLVRNLSGQDKSEETTEFENPFLNADPKRVQELYEQAKAVERMQQEAALNVEFDRDGNPYYPENEAMKMGGTKISSEQNTEIQRPTQNENAKFFESIKRYLEDGATPVYNEFKISETPQLLQYAGVPNHEIVITTKILNNAKNAAHNLDNEEILSALKGLVNPIIIFDSDKEKSEAKGNSVLIFTEGTDKNNSPLAIGFEMETQKQGIKENYVVNQINSIHSRTTLINSRGENMLEKWTVKGLLKYVDDKKISGWLKDRQVQFPLSLANPDEINITDLKGDVKHFSVKTRTGFENLTNMDISKEDMEYIHSSEFIEKFGDWEKANRLEKLIKAESIIGAENIFVGGNDITDLVKELRTSYSKDNLKQLQDIEKDIGAEVLDELRKKQGMNSYEIPSVTNLDNGKEYKIHMQGIKEVGRHNLFQKGHIEAVRTIPTLIENSVFLGKEKNEDNRNPSLREFHYFASGMRIGDEDYTAKIVFTLNDKGEFFYDQSLSTIEKGKFVDIIREKNKPEVFNPKKSQDNSELSDEYPSTYYDKRLYQICQVPQMPYLEKNGDGQWQPAKEAIEAVRRGELMIKKEGQSYEMVEKSPSDKTESVQKTAENSKTDNLEERAGDGVQGMDGKLPSEFDRLMQDKFQGENETAFRALDDYLERGMRPKNDEFIFSSMPEVLHAAGISSNEIVIKTSVINKAMKEHGLSVGEVRDAIQNISNPVLIFNTDNASENKKESILALTDVFAQNGKPVAFSMNLDSEYERKNKIIEVNEIRTIHDRTLVVKNGTDLIQKWTADGLCRYVDDKKISEWSKAAGVQFPLAVLQSDTHTIFTKSDFVKKISSDEAENIQKRAENSKTDNVQGMASDEVQQNEGKHIQTMTERQADNPDDKKQDTAQTIGTEEREKDALPAFALMTKDGLKMFEGYRVQGFDNVTRKYTVENERGDSIKMDEATIESIRNPRNTMAAEKEESVEAVQTQSAIVAGRTMVPEFAMITQNGLREFKGMVVQKYSPSEKMWILSNAEGERVSVSENTFKELTSENQRSRAKEFDENTPAYKKMLETQYNDYFKQRENTASNFIHNLSVYSRKEANSPIDAIRLSSVIIKQMSPGEKQKTRELLKTLCKDGETINGLIANTYLEAVKDKPLNEEYILSGRYKDTIARPMYDTISAKGEKVDNKFNLRIGDTVSNVSFKTKKTFGAGSERMVADWTVISASKEGNIITLKSGNSFRDVPRDTFLKQYSKQEKNEQKQEVKERKRNPLNMNIER